MSINIVGNVIKDVYLNLDNRKNHFEIDDDNIKWLNLGFNASSNHYFSRNSSLGGAAISLEVLEKLGLPARISNSNLKFENGELASENNPAETYRYILISDGGASYITPSEPKITEFTPPTESIDYLYLDRSAKLDNKSLKKIQTYLELSTSTKLILYVKLPLDLNLLPLLPLASLIILEKNRGQSAKTYAPELSKIPPEKIIKISENLFSYLNITERVSPNRIDLSTHLSFYSIAAATILGGFILGRSVEESLRLARLNVENSKLDSVLILTKLEELKNTQTESPNDDLELIAANLVLGKKGILAADESGGSIKKKFAQLDIPDTYETRRDYRNIFITTPDLEHFINGVILFDETARQQADNGQNFVDYLTSRRIIPGIKVDQGLEPFENSLETYTKGLDDLPNRLAEYYNLGLRFAKWRAAFEIRISISGNLITPTDHAINENCRILAKYAKDCQQAGIVPIVEPEVVYDGYYPIEKSSQVTAKILDCLFTELAAANVNLRACILKVNMVTAGKRFVIPSTPAEVGQATADVLKNHVPESLAGVVFLSGGQTPEQATENLAAIIKNGPFPWPVTFSFARALQDPALYAWAGDNTNTEAAKNAFKSRLKANTEVL